MLLWGQTSSNSICQDESDENEEINLMAKNFRNLFRKGVKKHDKFDKCKEKTKGGESSRRKCGCYNCGNKNHFIGDCPNPKRNKALVGGSWSDSKDGNEPQNDATCLMAIDSQEEHSKLLSKINDLEFEVKKLVNDREVVEPCKKCDVLAEEVDSLKCNVSKLQDEALNFSKFKKSSIVLDDMLIRQKLSQDKEGLGFSKNCKTTSISLNKPITFVKEGQNEALEKSALDAPAR
ncbi:protein CHUP1, chloroplastic [Tanacetum coccineum]